MSPEPTQNEIETAERLEKKQKRVAAGLKLESELARQRVVDLDAAAARDFEDEKKAKKG